VRNTQTMGGESLFFGLLARENRSGSHTRLCQVDRCLPRKNARRVPEPAKHLPNHRCERAFELFFNRLLRNSAHELTRLATSDQLTSQGESNSDQVFLYHGKKWAAPKGLHWKTTVVGL